MMTCKEASRLISEGQERPMSLMERWGLRIHLWMCDNCRKFDRQIAFLRKALRMLGEELETGSQGPDLPSEAKDRIRQVLRDRDHS
jgi:predicted anti-sigma-YlaC factor YlaD